MINYSQAGFYNVSLHEVGNQTNGDHLQLAKAPLDLSDTRLHALLFNYFITPFTQPEFYAFSFSNDDFTLNPLFQFASAVFDDASTFHKQTRNIAKHLFELSTHPNIKSGDLFVAYIANLIVEDQQVDALGIFKAENKQAFLKLEAHQFDFSIFAEDGINIDKLDKGCLILNTDRDTGFRICMIDKSNKGNEAQYWRDDFLGIIPRMNDYNQTKEFLNITKSYVTTQISQEFEVTKTDQIDLLNRSVEYFKSHEAFDKKEFEQEVLQDAGIIKSFRKYDEAYQEEHQMELNEQFSISSKAVKKQARVFKSVLKLDKNFHIYIHGNRDLIEQGVDADGRKYYKIYFEEEQ